MTSALGVPQKVELPKEEILSQWRSGEALRSLAPRYGVSASTLSNRLKEWGASAWVGKIKLSTLSGAAWMKRCTSCKRSLRLDAFDRSEAGREGRMSRCRRCLRRRRIESDYGEHHRVERAWNEQGGECAICGTLIHRGAPRSRTSACVDHCHSSGLVRGWLCHRCNVAIGLMDDCVDRLESAADYLRRHQASSSQRRGQGPPPEGLGCCECRGPARRSSGASRSDIGKRALSAARTPSIPGRRADQR